MSPEKKYLIEDLLDEQHAVRRNATLLAGAEVLRRKRVRRVALRSLAALVIVGLVALSIQWALTPSNPGTTIPTVALVPPAPDQPKALTDEELLALFPNTPVALATLDNGKKRLIFPHPGDEQKFITRL